RVLDTVRLVQRMTQAGHAFCVVGNHDVKLVKALRGKNVKVTHGLAQSLAQFDALPEEQRAAVRVEVAHFLDWLASHYLLDGGRLGVAVAGSKEEYRGRG